MNAQDLIARLEQNVKDIDPALRRASTPQEKQIVIESYLYTESIRKRMGWSYSDCFANGLFTLSPDHLMELAGKIEGAFEARQGPLPLIFHIQK